MICVAFVASHVRPLARQPTQSNLQKLAAGAGDSSNPGYIWTSTDSGVTWTEQIASGQRQWESIASSSDGTVRGVRNEAGNTDPTAHPCVPAVSRGGRWALRSSLTPPLLDDRLTPSNPTQPTETRRRGL